MNIITRFGLNSPSGFEEDEIVKRRLKIIICILI
jgi:hypothetical protein